MKKLDFINSMRGLAILGVLLCHTNQYGNTTLPNTLRNILNEGSKGVQLFYLASAFTLFLSFKTRYGNEKNPVRNFYLRRLFRIAPLYYLGIIYYLFQNGFGPRYWLGNETKITITNILSNLIFLHGFNPYWINSLVPGGWSIAVEMTFYAILPVLFLKIRNLNQAFILFNLCLLLRLLLYLLFTKFPLISDLRLWNEYLYFYFPSQLPVFCLGILLYFLVIEKEGLNNISGKSFLVFIILFLAQLITGTFYILPMHILFGIGFLLLGLAISKYPFPIIVNSIVGHIGEISFSMYIVHFAVLHWLAQFNLVDYSDNAILNFLGRFSVVLSLTILISNVLHRTIELPFQEIGKRIIRRFENSIVPNQETIPINE